jgi:3-dehydroquinate synthase
MQIPLSITETRTGSVLSAKPGWEELKRILQDYDGRSRKCFLLVDENTERDCLPLFHSLLGEINPAELLKIAPGEQAKSIDSAKHLWEQLSSFGASRDSLLINLGGGVVCDLGGFVASTFMRGIPFINIPTTSIAMADAAIGGKTAVNLQAVKNRMGTFSLPRLTLIDTRFLRTLGLADLHSGLAEIYKTALVADLSFWNRLTSPELTGLISVPIQEILWEEVIERSAGLKWNIVEDDFRDQGRRAILNFGHTFGHAFESLSMLGNRLPVSHGVAVAMGMICECYLSVNTVGLAKEEMARISVILRSVFGYYPLSGNDIPAMLSFMTKDKKVNEGNLCFTLLRKPGEALTGQCCNEKLIIEAFEYYRRMEVRK